MRCMNFVIYFILTCELSIWQGSFSYKDVISCFENFIVLQGSLMACNIIFKCGKNSKSFSYKDSLFILATQEKKGWWYLLTYSLAYFREFPNPTRIVKGRQQKFSCFEMIL